jgi:hypothetical protein
VPKAKRTLAAEATATRIAAKLPLGTAGNSSRLPTNPIARTQRPARCSAWTSWAPTVSMIAPASAIRVAGNDDAPCLPTIARETSRQCPRASLAETIPIAAASSHAATAWMPTRRGRERTVTTSRTRAQSETASKKNCQMGSRKPGKLLRNVASALSNWSGGYAATSSPRPTNAAAATSASVVRLDFGPSRGDE